MCKLPVSICVISNHSPLYYTFTLCTLVYSNGNITIILHYSYGLAPGRPFPAGHEDSIAVTKHVMENLEHYGIVSNRIFTVGKSITYSCCCVFKVYSGVSLQSSHKCAFITPTQYPTSQLYTFNREGPIHKMLEML